MKSRIICYFFLIGVLSFCNCKNQGHSPTENLTPSETNRQVTVPISDQWNDQKYHLNIDFGLHSLKGNQSIISRDEQDALAAQFNGSGWNPTQLLDFAKSVGFQSITFPAKNINGFCLYNTAQSEFNVVKSTPFAKDALKEIADECKTLNMPLGISFSFLDWNFTKTGGPSDHFAERISDELLNHNLLQLEELLTQYGPISHIQFANGSLTESQSKAILSKVKSIQPACMVNGLLTLENDFILVQDKQYADNQFDLPWRCMSSLKTTPDNSNSSLSIPEQKLKNLLEVISTGGQYMLTASLSPSGDISSKDQANLQQIGNWIGTKSEVIYNAKPSTFGIRSWGAVAAVEGADKLYIYIINWPKDGRINLYGLNNSVYGLYAINRPDQQIPFTKQSKNLIIDLNGQFEKELNVTVLVLEYTSILNITPLKMAYANSGKWELSAKNAVVSKTIERLNQYATAPMDHTYTWNLPPTSGGSYALKCKYTRQEVGNEISIKIAGKSYDLSLDANQIEDRPESFEIIYGLYYQGTPSLKNQIFTTRHGPTKGFPKGVKWGFNGEVEWIERDDWNEGEIWDVDAPPMSSTYVYQSLYSQADQIMVSSFTSDDGVTVWSDGNLIAEVLNTNKKEQTMIEIPIGSGNNQLMYRFFNNDGDHKISIDHNVLAAQFVKSLDTPIQLKNNTIESITLTRKDGTSKPLYLTNFSIEITPVEQM